MTHIFDVVHVFGGTSLEHLFLSVMTASRELELCSWHHVLTSDSAETGKYKSRTSMCISQLF